jgi:hypothetical protein
VSSTPGLHDVAVEDLLRNSLDGDVLEQLGKDRSLENLLPVEPITIKIEQKCNETFEKLAAKESRLISN